MSTSPGNESQFAIANGHRNSECSQLKKVMFDSYVNVCQRVYLMDRRQSDCEIDRKTGHEIMR